MDVGQLPTIVFGRKALTWWGTMGFVAIEGTTLIVCAITYLYLRKNTHEWPPAPTRLPDPLRPTLSVLFLALTNIPNYWVHQKIRKMDKRGAAIGLLVMALLATVAVILRVFDFRDLNMHWDTNAYASAAWVTVGAHTSLLFFEMVETWVFTALFWFGPIEGKHFSDGDDNCLYWYFMSLAWVPLYFLIYWSPRLL
jgi:heme/copper-type cytochrome/quinol oxidase subunit 3